MGGSYARYPAECSQAGSALMWISPGPVPLYADEESDTFWVLLPKKQEIYALSQTSCAIWECAQGASSVGEILRDLHRVFGWDENAIQTHVEKFIEELVGLELLEWSAP